MENKAINLLGEASIILEKLRVQAQVRKTHLGLRGRDDQLTDEVFDKLKETEDFINNALKIFVKSHAAYPWFSRINGIGDLNIAKVICQVDITRGQTPSSLCKFAGYSVDNGKAPGKIKGEKTSYNSRLRPMCWRLGVSGLKAKGKLYDYYLKEKNEYIEKYQNNGVAIVPSASLPKKNGKHYEPPGMISEGHINNMALRKMIKLFLQCLWIVWRQIEGLPVTKPYAIDILGHDSYIDPWSLCDKE